MVVGGRGGDASHLLKNFFLLLNSHFFGRESFLLDISGPPVKIFGHLWSIVCTVGVDSPSIRPRSS